MAERLCIKNKIQIRSVICGLLLGTASMLSANDAEANAEYLKARELEKAGKYQKAAGKYKDARILADSMVIKGNALIATARNLRKAHLYGEEFDCLQRLIREHLSGINFAQVVQREYEIGDLFFRGHRDSPIAWLPFLKKDDRTMEIYEEALKNAPCSDRAPEARLRLARLYIDAQKSEKAVKHLMEASKLYPGTDAAHDAMLELANLLFQLARNGDGDNSYSRRTLVVLDEFEQTYPDSKEIPWVKKHRQKVLNFIAGRLHAIGKYYKRVGRNDTAGEYFADIVKNYSDTEIAEESEKVLASLEKDYKVPKEREPYKPYKYPLKVEEIPEEASPIMVVPENSDNKWLLPIRDLKRSSVRAPGDQPAKEVSNEDI